MKRNSSKRYTKSFGIFLRDCGRRTAPPLTGFGQSLLAPGLARQAQEHGSEAHGTGAKAADGSELTPAQEQALAKLKQVDRAVRAHEQAHASTGGQYAGSPSYTYVQG